MHQPEEGRVLVGDNKVDDKQDSRFKIKERKTPDVGDKKLKENFEISSFSLYVLNYHYY